MELNLHANATTTPKVRAYIQRSKRSVAELAAELGVSETTIRRWRGRRTVNDHSHRPKTLQTSFSPMEESLVCELRTRLQLPLDDIVEVMRRCVNDELSRSAIHRCLKRHGLSQRPNLTSLLSASSSRPPSDLSILTSSTCQPSSGTKATPSSPSIARHAMSIWRSTPSGMRIPRPASWSASSPTSRMPFTPSSPTMAPSSPTASPSI